VPLARIRRRCYWLASLFSAGWVLVGDAQQQPPAHVPGLERQIQLDLPATPERLIPVMGRVATVMRAPFGAELVVESEPARGRGSTGPRTPPTPTDEYYDLTGLGLSEVFDRLVKFLPQYSWDADRMVPHFRPVRFRNNRDVALNRMVEQFVVDHVTVREALFAVQKIFDPGYPVPATPAPHAREQLQPLMTKVISVSLEHASVMSILDEIARQHGSAAWLVRYRDVTGSHKRMIIEFLGFDGWAVSASAR
jgi:hypothetical protein